MRKSGSPPQSKYHDFLLSVDSYHLRIAVGLRERDIESTSLKIQAFTVYITMSIKVQDTHTHTHTHTVCSRMLHFLVCKSPLNMSCVHDLAGIIFKREGQSPKDKREMMSVHTRIISYCIYLTGVVDKPCLVTRHRGINNIISIYPEHVAPNALWRLSIHSPTPSFTVIQT